jgi:group I intron endonuclease
MWRHLSYLRNGNHKNNYLQNSFNKYGEKSFVFEVILEVNDVQLLEKYEQELIDAYRLDGQKLYNIRHNASSNIGLKHTKEVCKDISERMLGNTINLGRNLTEDTKRKISKSHIGKIYDGQEKQIIQMDAKTKEPIKFWNSILEAAQNLNVHPSNICKACKGHSKTSAGFAWRYA